MDLNHEEITLLIEALDAWVNRRTSGEMVSDLLGAVLAKDSPELQGKLDKRRTETEREKMLDADTATLLKAKLIKMRQTIFTKP